MAAKVSLSEFEMQLVQNKQWVLTKNAIIQKVYELFGSIAVEYANTGVLQQLPFEVIALPPKISKGENYKGLPYVMLDYPRCFGRDDVFAIRTFFWWGNYFTITLHLKGIYKQNYQQQLINALKNGMFADAWVNNSNEEWEHDVHAATMQPASTIQQLLLHEKEVLKLVIKLNLEEWEQAVVFFKENFQLLLNTITG